MFYNILNDFFTLFTTQDDHRSFRRQLEAKRPVIETNLISGRQHVANEPPVSDISDNEGNLQSFLAHISPGDTLFPINYCFYYCGLVTQVCRLYTYTRQKYIFVKTVNFFEFSNLFRKIFRRKLV